MTKEYCNRFWGDLEKRSDKLRFFVHCFAGCERVLDLGCGRGEFLGLLKESGIKAVGVDGDLDQIDCCRDAGLDVFQDDIFAFLERDHSFDGIMISQVIEHLDGSRAEELLSRSYKMLNPGGRLVVVTPNPENLSVMTNIFWLDVTHVRPYPLPLLVEMFVGAGLEIVSSGEDLMSMESGWKLQIRRKIIGPALRLIGMGQLSDNLFSTLNIFVVGQKPQNPNIAQRESEL